MRYTLFIAPDTSVVISSTVGNMVDKVANFLIRNKTSINAFAEEFKQYLSQGPHCSDETVHTLLDFARSNGKTPIWVKKEINGFIANRIAKAVGTEAFYLAEQGIASPQDIDTAVENGLNYPMGPFRLQDFSGIDIAFNARQREYEETGVKPIGYDLQQEKVKKGELGRKTGKGWYNYTK